MALIERAGWRLEPRAQPHGTARLLALVAAMLGAALVSSLLFVAVGARPSEAMFAIVRGAAGSWRSATETLVKATPLILTGLATAVAFRARIWNIGAEGQVFAGAMFAYWCQSTVSGQPAAVQFPVVIAGAMVGGALYAGLAGVLKTAFRVDEVISTVMLNYVIIYVLSLLLLGGPWSEAGNFFEQTAQVAEASELPVLFERSRLHIGFLLALAAALIVHLMMTQTPFGFEIRASGSNLRALEVQGTNVARLVVVIMLASGALAGLAGATEVYGVHHRLKAGAVAGYGYAGIIVAILGQLNPWGIVVAGIAFGALVNGATLMQIETGVPSALIYAIEAILLIFFLVGWAASSFRLRRVGRA